MVGLGFWTTGRSLGSGSTTSAGFSPIYSIMIVTWSIIFVESWRIKERVLAVRWGTYGVERVEILRAGFKGSEMRVERVSGEMRAWFPWWKTLLRQLACTDSSF